MCQVSPVCSPLSIPCSFRTLYVGKLSPMNDINWLQCLLGFWWSLANDRYYEDGREGEESGEVHFSSFVPSLSLWISSCLSIKEQSSCQAILPNQYATHAHLAQWWYEILPLSTAITLVFLNRGPQSIVQTPRGPAPLSGTV